MEVDILSLLTSSAVCLYFTNNFTLYLISLIYVSIDKHHFVIVICLNAIVKN